jgi:integrase
MKFTDHAIRALKARVDRYEVYADSKDGFGVRVFPSGAKTWITRYRRPDRTLVKVTLGNYPEMSLSEARVKHNEHRKLIHQGKDPRALAAAAKSREQDAGTVAELAREYIERWAKPRKKSWSEDARQLAKDILPAWGKRKAKDITRRDVIKLLDGIADRGAGVAANRTLALLSKMFRFGIDRGIVETSPCIAITKPTQETPRDRVLHEDEIRAFWKGLDHARISETIKPALKLELVTAQRRGEVAAAARAEFDLAPFDTSGGWWTIPAARSKNKLAHRVPLSPLATDLVRQLLAFSDGSPWLIPSPRGKGPITERAMTRAISNNRAVFGIDHFTPHDLRRTAASHMTGMGIPRLVVSKVLNHAETGITAVYDRHSYDQEKRQALETWARKLQSIITGETGNVVAIRRGTVASSLQPKETAP